MGGGGQANFSGSGGDPPQPPQPPPPTRKTLNSLPFTLLFVSRISLLCRFKDIPSSLSSPSTENLACLLVVLLGPHLGALDLAFFISVSIAEYYQGLLLHMTIHSFTLTVMEMLSCCLFVIDRSSTKPLCK